MPSNLYFQNVKIDFSIGDLILCVKQINYGIFTESYTRHRHGKNYYELHLVCGGKGQLILENEEYELNNGSLFMTGPEVLHEQLTDKIEPMHEYCMGIEIRRKKNAEETSFGNALLNTAFWIGTDSGECERLFTLLSKESKNLLIGCSINIQNAISSILVELVRHYTNSQQGQELSKIMPDDKRMNIVDGYFLYNYATASEKELGSILGSSVRQVQRFLIKNYGKTFCEMKHEAKLHKAAELIKNGVRVDDAASIVGYSSSQYFRRLLKRAEGN